MDSRAEIKKTKLNGKIMWRGHITTYVDPTPDSFSPSESESGIDRRDGSVFLRGLCPCLNKSCEARHNRMLLLAVGV